MDTKPNVPTVTAAPESVNLSVHDAEVHAEALKKEYEALLNGYPISKKSRGDLVAGFRDGLNSMLAFVRKRATQEASRPV